MTVIAKVKNGAVALPPGTDLPEGAVVQLIVSDSPSVDLPASDAEPPDWASGFGQWMLEFAGTAKGLPEDMAEEHDHYIHGTPKRKLK